MPEPAFPLIYEIAGHRRCYLIEPGTVIAVGRGADCRIKLEWEGVSELEATLKVVDHSSVDISVPGQVDLTASLPLTLDVGGRELAFFRPQDMAGYTSEIDAGSRFNLEAFTKLAKILESYSKNQLDQFRIWKMNQNRAATLSMSAACQVNDLTHTTSEVVVSALRHIAATSDNLEMQKKANEALLKFAQSQHN